MSKIFYSWQSFSTSTNRNFIEKALEFAAKTLRRDEMIEVEPVVDRDTKNTPGAVDILETIFKKIERSDVFVADVSIINRDEANFLEHGLMKLKLLPRTSDRLIPNPNVLIETGYAFHALGVSKIILIMNIYFGEPDLLPFDLKTKRVLTYYLPPKKTDKADERKRLEKSLEGALRDIYTALDTIFPDLTDVDNAVFNILCNAVIINEHDTFQQKELFELAEQFGNEEAFSESLHILNSKNIIKGTWYASGKVYFIRISAHGFDLYARHHISKYKVITESIIKEIINKNNINSVEITDTIRQPVKRQLEMESDDN